MMEKVLVAISGGVDSSVAAFLLAISILGGGVTRGVVHENC